MYLALSCKKLIFTRISNCGLIWNLVFAYIESRGSGASLQWTLILMAAILEGSRVMSQRDAGEHHEVVEAKTGQMWKRRRQSTLSQGLCREHGPGSSYRCLPSIGINQGTSLKFMLAWNLYFFSIVIIYWVG